MTDALGATNTPLATRGLCEDKENREDKDDEHFLVQRIILRYTNSKSSATLTTIAQKNRLIPWPPPHKTFILKLQEFMHLYVIVEINPTFSKPRFMIGRCLAYVSLNNSLPDTVKPALSIAWPVSRNARPNARRIAPIK